jgi:MFS transporter, PPP family, 3-phenylpropionic acid transporter
MLFGVAEAALLPFFALLLSDRGMAPDAIGVVLALTALAGFASSPLWGYAADRRLGPERAIATSSTATCAAAVLHAAERDDVLFVLAALLVYACRAPVTSLGDALALNRLGRSGRGRYGTVRVWMSAGFAVAAAGWGLLFEFESLDLAPAVYASAIALVALWSALWLGGGAAPLPGLDVAEVGTYGRAALSPRFLVFLASLLLVSAAFVASWNFLALRIVGIGGSALLVGAAAALQAAAEIPLMAWSSRITRRLSHRAVFACGCTLYAVVFAAWALIVDPLGAAAVNVAAGFGFAFYSIGSVLVVDDVVPRRLRATGQSLAKAMATGLAPIVGGLGGGLVYDRVGPRSMFLLAAAVAAAGGAIGWLAVPAQAGERVGKAIRERA